MKTVTKIRKCMWQGEGKLAHQPRQGKPEKGPHSTMVNETIISERGKRREWPAEEEDCDGARESASAK